MNSDLLTHLNAEQREAVLHIQSPLLVVAGAGSGKTRIISYKIAFLLREMGIHPQNFLGVTFTNRAADEMKNRIAALTGVHPRMFSISTFHSLGLRILRESGAAFGFGPEWIVMDEEEQKKAFKTLNKESRNPFPSDELDLVMRKINLAKMNLLYPNHEDSLEESGLRDMEINLYSRYFQYQKDKHLWDYEDLVSFPVFLLRNLDAVSQKYQRRFPYIVIDEFQDINPNQYELIKQLALQCKQITAVGDEDQAIYSWRGASIRFLFDFEHDFQGTRVIKLEQNYRSTPQILNFANRLISFNMQRRGKTMWTNMENGHRVYVLKSPSKEKEAEKIARLILMLKKNHPELFPLAILYRINSQSLILETELLKHNIPFQIIKGLRFFDRKEIKDSLALLRLAFHPDDDLAFQRLTDFLPLGIGEKRLEELKQKSNSRSLFKTLKEEMSDRFYQYPIFLTLERIHSQVKPTPISSVLRELLTVSGYHDYLEEKKENERLLNIAELTEFIEKWEIDYPQETFGELIDRMTVESIRRRDDFQEKVYLLTMHNAKGLEFPTVVSIGINSAFMPFFLRKDSLEIEEERRLLYVASTRASNLLILSTGSERTSPFLQILDSSLYSKVESPEEIEADLTRLTMPSPPPESERFLLHPLFGKGRILEELSSEKFLVHFQGRGNKLIDTSIVSVEFV